MSFTVNSQVNHPITLSLVSGVDTDSRHLMANEVNVEIDDKYRFSPDIVNGLRTRKLALNHAPTRKSETKSPVTKLLDNVGSFA